MTEAEPCEERTALPVGAREVTSEEGRLYAGRTAVLLAGLAAPAAPTEPPAENEVAAGLAGCIAGLAAGAAGAWEVEYVVTPCGASEVTTAEPEPMAVLERLEAGWSAGPGVFGEFG